jgi:hypothetical protein
MHLGWREEGVRRTSKKDLTGTRGRRKGEFFVALHPMWMSGYPAPQEYEWRSQERAAIDIDAEVKAVLARVSCLIGKAVPQGRAAFVNRLFWN